MPPVKHQLTYSNDWFAYTRNELARLTTKRLALLAGSRNAIMPGEWPSHVTLAPVMGAGELKGRELMPAVQRSYGSLELAVGQAFGRNAERNSVDRLELGGDGAFGAPMTQYEVTYTTLDRRSK